VAIGENEKGKKILGKRNRNSARPSGTVRRSNRGPCRCGFGLDSPNSVSTTAEDGLRDPRKNALLGVACSSASITAFGPARQRCECCRIELRKPAASPLLLTVAPSLARKSTDSPCENIPRSAPAAAETLEGDNARSTCGAANGTPCHHRNRRSEIQNTAGTIAGQENFLSRCTSEKGHSDRHEYSTLTL
jgi:hypothetical protein